jgi:putative tricarboxylic transport membrane protein
MELFDQLSMGFGVALSFQNLGFCLVGALLGTLIGVLPGIGPVATIALLLPLTYALPPTGALIMLAGIYYGAQYGGSTTAILVNLPGEASSVVTAIDGYQMARRGRAGAALAIAAIGSFFAGSVAILAVAAIGPPLGLLAQKFGPSDYASLMALGLVAAVVLAGGSVLKAIAMVVVGLLLGLVGTDVNSGTSRFTLGLPELADGIGFVPLAMGLFGVAEILRNLEGGSAGTATGSPVTARIGTLWPDRAEWRRAWPAMLRGSSLGAILGVLPGGGPVLGSFAAYSLEKRLSKEPDRFGKGAPEGVAGPESANNAGAQTSFIPLLTLGLPPNPTMALMVGAMTIHGIVPGPQVMTSQPALFWGLIASMWIGNLMLLVINLPMVGLWVQLLRVPYRLLYPAILLFAAIGVYGLNNSPTEVVMTAIFGVAGYLLLRLGLEPAPLLLGFILGPLLEEQFRRALLLSRGDPAVFLDPSRIGFYLLALALFLLIGALFPRVKRLRDVAF